MQNWPLQETALLRKKRERREGERERERERRREWLVHLILFANGNGERGRGKIAAAAAFCNCCCCCCCCCWMSSLYPLMFCVCRRPNLSFQFLDWRHLSTFGCVWTERLSKRERSAKKRLWKMAHWSQFVSREVELRKKYYSNQDMNWIVYCYKVNSMRFCSCCQISFSCIFRKKSQHCRKGYTHTMSKYFTLRDPSFRGLYHEGMHKRAFTPQAKERKIKREGKERMR